jgi:hypothetical protein
VLYMFMLHRTWTWTWTWIWRNTFNTALPMKRHCR